MMFDRRLLTNFNWGLLAVILALSAIGITNLYSATSSFDSTVQMNFFQDHMLRTGIGLFFVLVITSVHYRHFQALSYGIYAFSMLLLVLVLVFGSKIYGHQSWLSLGPVRIQPSEFAKLGFIIGMARHMTTWIPGKNATLKDLIPSFILFLIPTLLVLLQGDLGSSLFFGLIYGTLILIHGVQKRILFSLLGGLAIVSVLAYFFFLSPYQKNRIATFMNPELDHKGSGYHLIQSKIAVGSGGFTGKGFLKGQTHKLKFIPERHTDFIFPVFAEEWGFLGALVVLGLFFIFFLMGLEIATRTPDRYGFYLVVGVCALFFWHLVINLGGVLGLMPLTGVPLPLFSYGGSALLTNWLGIALLLNISMRRFMFT